MTRTMLAGVAGGMALFVWGFISHGILPFHNMAYDHVTDEVAVSEVLRQHAPESGLYFVPYAEAEHTPDRVRAFINVLAPGADQNPLRQILLGLLAQIVVASIGVVLVNATDPSRYSSWVWRFALVGTIIGFSTPVFYWNWFGFPTLYTLVMVGDSVAGWTLAGIAVALLLGLRPDLMEEAGGFSYAVTAHDIDA